MTQSVESVQTIIIEVNIIHVESTANVIYNKSHKRGREKYDPGNLKKMNLFNGVEINAYTCTVYAL